MNLIWPHGLVAVQVEQDVNFGWKCNATGCTTVGQF